MAASYIEIGINVYLTFCKRAVIRTFKKLEFGKSFDFANIYPSTDDAVNHILRFAQLQTISSNAEGELNHGAIVVDEVDDELTTAYPEFVYKKNNSNEQDEDSLSIIERF